MDKIILIFYLGYDQSMSSSDIYKKTDDARKSLQEILDKNNILGFWVPVVNESTHIECVNPKIVSEVEYQDVKKILEDYQQKLNIFLKKAQDEK